MLRGTTLFVELQSGGFLSFFDIQSGSAHEMLDGFLAKVGKIGYTVLYGSTEDLQKKADAMLKAVNEHATRERQMEKAIKNMDQLDS